MPRYTRYRRRNTRRFGARRFKRYPRRQLYRRRRITRRRRIGGQSVSIRRGWVPARYFCKLVYQQNISPSAGIGANGIYNFVGNSCYDPDSTGTGLQPAGFDQLMLLFRYCRVHASGISVIFDNVLANSKPEISILPSLSSSVDATDYAEQPYAKTRFLSHKGVTQARTHVKHFCTTKKIWNVRNITDSTAWAHTSGANPPNAWYWKIIWHEISSLVSTQIDMYVKITYHCEFFNRYEISEI